MVSLDYLDGFQIFAATWVIVVIGAICGFVKMFDPKDIYAIQRLVYLVPIPAMLFNEIGLSDFSGKTWKTFGHAVVISLLMHLLSFVYAYFTKGNKTLMRRFIEVAIAYCESDFFYHSYAIAQILFDSKINIHATLSCFVQYAIVIPLHTILAILFIPEALDNMNKEESDEVVVPIEPKEKKEEEEDELEENPSNNEEKHSSDKSDHNSTTETVPGPDGNPVHVTKENKETTQAQEQAPPPPDVPKPPKLENPKEPWTKEQHIVFSFCNQYTICAFLGILWSAIDTTMPKFLSSFVTDLEKSCIAACLFTVGCTIAYHPFKGAPVLDVVLGCIFHFIVQPLLSIAFSYAFSLDKKVSMYLIFVNSTPTSIAGNRLSYQLGFGDSIVSYNHYWTNALSLPVFLLWTVIINETKLFA